MAAGLFSIRVVHDKIPSDFKGNNEAKIFLDKATEHTVFHQPQHPFTGSKLKHLSLSLKRGWTNLVLTHTYYLCCLTRHSFTYCAAGDLITLRHEFRRFRGTRELKRWWDIVARSIPLISSLSCVVGNDIYLSNWSRTFSCTTYVHQLLHTHNHAVAAEIFAITFGQQSMRRYKYSSDDLSC